MVYIIVSYAEILASKESLQGAVIQMNRQIDQPTRIIDRLVEKCKEKLIKKKPTTA